MGNRRFRGGVQGEGEESGILITWLGRGTQIKILRVGRRDRNSVKDRVKGDGVVIRVPQDDREGKSWKKRVVKGKYVV